MLKWYQSVFDARVQYADPALAFLTFDDEHHRFAFANLSVLQPNGATGEEAKDKQGAVGVDHLGYSYGSLTDLFEKYATLKEQGIRPYWCIHHGITVSLYYADPDGNQMEFQVDSLDSSKDASQFMKELFSLNPLGVEIDPDEWLAKLRAGTPESELLPRKTHEPVSPIRGSFMQSLG